VQLLPTATEVVGLVGVDLVRSSAGLLTELFDQLYSPLRDAITDLVDSEPETPADTAGDHERSWPRWRSAAPTRPPAPRSSTSTGPSGCSAPDDDQG
jgi:hypothetical protein